VSKWRLRFLKQRLNGLYDEVRRGKPRTIDDERMAQLIQKTLHTKPADGSTHWSVRMIAAETAISPTSVHRYFKLQGLQPHRSESFRLSTDQFFIEKLRDVVGLYLSPPENALVLCVDEKKIILSRNTPVDVQQSFAVHVELSGNGLVDFTQERDRNS
jgi:AraC-like DNA-binding protein